MTSEAEPVPPPFGGSYAKARKAYGISSALLMAWELVGIEIDPAPVQALRVSLKSPHAAPYVLIAFVAYFAFHFTVEWYQTAELRRRLLPSRIDFAAAHCLGLASLTLYAIQALLRVQIADVLMRLSDVVSRALLEALVLDVGLGFMTAVSVWCIRPIRRRWRTDAKSRWPIVILIVVAPGMLIGAAWVTLPALASNPILLVLGYVAGIFLYLGWWAVYKVRGMVSRRVPQSAAR